VKWWLTIEFSFSRPISFQSRAFHVVQMKPRGLAWQPQGR
jgi:hypothetical protein